MKAALLCTTAASIQARIPVGDRWLYWPMGNFWAPAPSRRIEREG